MKKILSISILALFLIFGISCVSAADPDSNCIQEINLGSGIGGGEYTPFYADLESGIGGGEYTPFYASLESGIGGGEYTPFYASLESGIGGGEYTPFYADLESGIGGGEYTPFYADLESGIGGGEYTPFYCANLNCNCLSFGYHGSGMGGNPFDPNFWDDSYPGGSLYGPTPENHNLQ